MFFTFCMGKGGRLQSENRVVTFTTNMKEIKEIDKLTLIPTAYLDQYFPRGGVNLAPPPLEIKI